MIERLVSQEIVDAPTANDPSSGNSEAPDAGDLRKVLGDPFIRGVGVEVGAGLRPVIHRDIEQLFFYDKRDSEEFEAYFNSKPPYEILTYNSLMLRFPKGLDFVCNHQVLEQADDPIRLLLDWIRLLKEDGVLYISVPSHLNICEKNRLLTPTRHFLEDFFFERSISSYESKEHIASFILAWTTLAKDLRPWYSNYPIEMFAEYTLWDIGSRDDHDLHWHTYTIESLQDIVEIAFFLAGFGSERLLSEEGGDAHYVAYRRTGNRAMPPAFVKFRHDITTLSEKLASF